MRDYRETNEPSARDLKEMTQTGDQAINFKAFFDAVTDLLMVADIDGRIIYTNPAVSAKLGYTPAQLEHMHILDLHPASMRAEAEAIFGRMLAGEIDSCLLPLQRASGETLPVHTRIWFGQWNGQDVIYGICKDLTGEQEALQKFDRLFRLNPVSMAVSDAEEGRLTDVNDAFLATLGYTREEVIGKSTIELGIFLDPQRRIEMGRELKERGRVSQVELQMRRRDGEIVSGLFSGELIESQGESYFATATIDITDLILTQQALMRSECLLTGLSRATQALLAHRAPGDSDISEALRILGETAGVDRTYIFENDHGHSGDRGSCSQRYEWSGDQAAPQIDNPELQDLPWDEFVPRWYEALSAGGCIVGDVADFPLGEREILEPQDILSLLVLPIRSSGRFWGFIGFDSCTTTREWEPSEVALLEAAGNSFGAAIERHRLQQELIDRAACDADRAKLSEGRFRTIFDRAPVGIVLVDAASSRFIEANSAFCGIVGVDEATLLELDFEHFAHTGDLDVAHAEIRALIDGSVDSKHAEKRYLRPDGNVVWISLAIVPVRGEDASGGKLIGIITDVTNRKAAEQVAERTARFDDLFASISTDLIGCEPDMVDASIEDALGRFARFVGVEYAYVGVPSSDGRASKITHGWQDPDARSLLEELSAISLDSSAWSSDILQGGSPVCISMLDNLSQDATAERELFSSLGIDSLLVVPMRGVHGAIVGVTGLASGRLCAEWSNDDIRFARMLGNAISNAIERQHAEQEIAESQMSTIYALAKLAESRDDETGGHIERVQELCHILAKELRGESAGIDDEFVDLLFRAAPLHDVGKVGIPDAILLKAGSLTPEEYAVVKTHTVIGANTLLAVRDHHPNNEFIRIGVDIARHHHERWDGNGYPDGLSGENIPVSARIMAVTDVYDAVRSVRVYKDAMTHREAVRIIVEGRGTQFDPTVVDAFLRKSEKFESVWAPRE